MGPKQAPEAPAEQSARRRPGRPPKPPGTKAVGVTVMLWPSELDQLERLRTAVNEGLPAEVLRSDLARLAFALVLEMTPVQVRKALAERRK